MKRAINLAEITEEGLLLVNKKDVWVLPEGKPNEGETDDECLFRELKKELSVSEKNISIYNSYGKFTGKTPFSNSILEAKVYFGALKGKLKPSAEISEAKHINNFENYKLSEITSKIIFSLKQDKYL